MNLHNIIFLVVYVCGCNLNKVFDPHFHPLVFEIVFKKRKYKLRLGNEFGPV